MKMLGSGMVCNGFSLRLTGCQTPVVEMRVDEDEDEGRATVLEVLPRELRYEEASAAQVQQTDACGGGGQGIGEGVREMREL